MSDLYYDDHTEIYVLDNLCWMFFDDKFGAHRVVTQKHIKSVDPDGIMLPPLGSFPVVREVCGKCGGYGGEQLEDGWFSCYRCCEIGYVYTPLNEYLMHQVHLDAHEDNYQHDLDLLPFETGDPRMLMGKDDIAETLGTLVAGEIDRLARLKEEDDIPF